MLIDPHTSDDLRRTTETKLFRHKQQRLQALPLNDKNKATLFAEVMEMAKGVVLLGLPDEPPWLFVIENTDTDTCEGYDLSILRRFVTIFPSSPITSLLKGYFQYMDIPLEEETSESEDEGKSKPKMVLEEDPLDLVLVSITHLSEGMFLTHLRMPTLNHPIPFSRTA